MLQLEPLSVAAVMQQLQSCLIPSTQLDPGQALQYTLRQIVHMVWNRDAAASVSSCQCRGPRKSYHHLA